MKKVFLTLGLGVLLTIGGAQTMSSATRSQDGTFNFPLMNPRHENMQRLLINAMGYLNPKHGLVDAASGYPVEGWNQDPQRGLYLRSFTQLTAIGERLEVLANIAAGFADNPYISRTEALDQLELMIASLLADQSDPQVSAAGLLANFLSFAATQRIGPLSEEVDRQTFVDAFGEEQGSQIWTALIARGWINPQQDGSFAKVPRIGGYGAAFFTGELAPFAQSDTIARIMAILDARVVQIIFGDNANLTASAAKAIGALLHPSIQDDPAAERLRTKLEQFIAGQSEGYRQLYDEQSDSFYFGWNATHDRHTGWEDGAGKWIVGHMDYLVNEFRGPLMFVAQRFGLPNAAISHSGVKIKPYRMADGRDLYTLASWNGSAFESLGLSLFMRELDAPGWKETLENSVDIELDFSTRHKLPGFLSEAYSGNGVEYTGNIGIPDLAITTRPRIIDAPSLYSLGTAYAVMPDKIEHFVGENRQKIEGLFTDHGPWEGYNTTQDRTIEFQTTAHTLALILGAIGASEQNMQRYLAWQGSGNIPRSEGQSSTAFDFLDQHVEWIPWSPTGDLLEFTRGEKGVKIRAATVRNGAITVKLPQDRPVDLSNGALLIRYRTTHPLAMVMTLAGGRSVLPNEIFSRFDVTDAVRDIRIPLPATPGLEAVNEMVLRFGDERNPTSVDVTLSGFEFIPAQ